MGWQWGWGPFLAFLADMVHLQKLAGMTDKGAQGVGVWGELTSLKKKKAKKKQMSKEYKHCIKSQI